MEKQAGRRAAATPENTVELIRFSIAYVNYVAVMGEDDAHAQKGARLVRRYAGSGKLLDEALKQTFEPLIDSGGVFTPFRDEMRRATRGTPVERGLAAGEFFTQIMRRLAVRRPLLESTLTGRKAYTIGVKIATGLEDDPRETLRNLAVIPSASGLRQLYLWVKESAQIVGATPDATEQALSDVETARMAGEELRQVKAAIVQAAPLSLEAEGLQDQKEEILDRIDEIASESEVPAVAFSAAAQQAAAPPYDHQTTMGAVAQLNAEQESAMLVTGKSIIAAGAGSGKTRVLAAKVNYHAFSGNDGLGEGLRTVIATSFSRKSAAELKGRVGDLGGVKLPNERDESMQGLGTTHSICGKLGTAYGILPPRDKKNELKEYEKLKIIKIAMRQVGLPAFVSGRPVPQEGDTGLGFFSGDFAKGQQRQQRQQQAPQQQQQQQQGLTFPDALRQAHANRNRIRNPWLRGWIEGIMDSGHWSSGWFNHISDNHQNPYRAHHTQTRSGKYVGNILDDVFGYAGVPYRLDADPLNTRAQRRTAAKKKVDTSLMKYTYWKQSADQWFNLGMKGVIEDNPAEGDEKGTPAKIPSAPDYARQITKLKGRLISPKEAWVNGVVDENVAAVYAAYEWLKGSDGEEDFAGKTGFDDLFINFIQGCLKNPQKLAQLQARFKTILVDEAQDLNRAQHVVFGLISGFIDPAKVEGVANVAKIGELAKDDGSMTAQTYTLIGDDKQAIYEFRGADPEAFIDMSDLMDGGAGFKTQLLVTNYRSGRLIVDAANRLISHNKKQIKMTCVAGNVSRGEGGVIYKDFAPIEKKNYTVPAQWFANDIEERMEEDQPAAGWDHFGIGLRTNAEAYVYGIELLKKGIPFRTKANFFRDPTTKAMKGWLTIARDGASSGDASNRRVRAQIPEILSTPTSFLGKDKIKAALDATCPSNVAVVTWLSNPDNQEALLQSGYRRVTSRQRQALRKFVENLIYATTLSGTNHKEIIETLLKGLSGTDGSTIMDALKEKVENNRDKMEELAAESEDGVVSKEQIEEAATQALLPLTTMMESSADLGGAMDYLEELEILNGKLVAEDDPEAKNFKRVAVTLGTMHSWKGLEVGVMYVPYVGGAFPRVGGKDPEGELASERRLAYVAVTRGEDEVISMNIPTIRMTKAGPVVQTSQFPTEMRCGAEEATTVDDSQGRTAAEITELSDEEFEALDAQMDGMMDQYFAEKDSSGKLASAWGNTLYDA
jgi:DNA helicase-2/ATP-dependent DNA helicase PcrA